MIIHVAVLVNIRVVLAVVTLVQGYVATAAQIIIKKTALMFAKVAALIPVAGVAVEVAIITAAEIVVR